MIQANEIRLGGIVLVDNPQFHPNLKDVPMVIKGIHTTERGYAVKLEHLIPSDDIFTEYSQLIQFIVPIPLTEEILLKAGFEKDTGEFYLYKDITVRKTYYSDDFWRFIFKQQRIKDIKYLHDLQNTIFALTGEEIKIEL